MSIHIGFDAKRYFFNSTGLGSYSRHLIAALQKFHSDKLKITLFSPRTPPHKIPLNRQIQTITPSGLSAKFSGSLWRSLMMSRDLKKSGISLYHGLSHELPFGIKKCGIASVLSMHDMLYLKHPKFYPLIDRLSYKIKYLLSCRQADAIIAVSRETADDLSKIYRIPPVKIKTIYQSCDPLFYCAPGRDEQKRVTAKYNIKSPFILYVGSFGARKNLPALLKSFARAKTANHCLVLAGHGPRQTPALKKLAAKFGVSQKVLFPGRIDQEDLPALYSSAEIFIYPSLGEGFGIPVLEALYSKTPVICSDTPCLREAGGPSTMYTSPKSMTGMANAMTTLIANPDLQEFMKINGLEHAKKFTWQGCASQTMQVYEQLCS